MVVGFPSVFCPISCLPVEYQTQPVGTVPSSAGGADVSVGELVVVDASELLGPTSSEVGGTVGVAAIVVEEGCLS